MIPRRKLPVVKEAQQAAVALTGLRQAGKTTLALTLAEDVPSIYLDLESVDDRRKLTDPVFFCASSRTGWLSWTKSTGFQNF